MSQQSNRVSEETTHSIEIPVAPPPAAYLPPYSEDAVEHVPPPPVYNANNPNNGPTSGFLSMRLTYREIIDESIRKVNTMTHLDKESPSHVINNTSISSSYTKQKVIHNQHFSPLNLAYHNAIDQGDYEYALKVITSGLLDANTTRYHGSVYLSPLIVAVCKRDCDMARLLLLHGALVNEMAYPDIIAGMNNVPCRTPLQVAAYQGHLPMVKMLMEEFNADPSIIAPDGQHALRLAVEAGHRHVVQYLPVVRGGGFRRLKTRCQKPIKKIARAASNTWGFCRALTYDAPKLIIIHCFYRPFIELCKLTWKGLKALPSFLRRQVQLAPDRFRRFGIWVKKEIIKLPERVRKLCSWIWKQMKKTPDRLVRLAKFMKKVVVELSKRLWIAIKLTASYILKISKTVASALLDILRRVISLLHTAILATLSFFRKLTITNIYHGILDVLHAIFVSFPQRLWDLAARFWETFFTFMEKVFHWFGFIIAFLIYIVFAIVTYIPRQIFKMLVGIVGLANGALREFRIWLNPKTAVDTV